MYLYQCNCNLNSNGGIGRGYPIHYLNIANGNEMAYKRSTNHIYPDQESIINQLQEKIEQLEKRVRQLEERG